MLLRRRRRIRALSSIADAVLVLVLIRDLVPSPGRVLTRDPIPDLIRDLIRDLIPDLIRDLTKEVIQAKRARARRARSTSFCSLAAQHRCRTACWFRRR